MASALYFVMLFQNFQSIDAGRRTFTASKLSRYLGCASLHAKGLGITR